MRLPKPGTKVEDLKCKVCGKEPKDQANEPEECDLENCPVVPTPAPEG